MARGRGLKTTGRQHTRRKPPRTAWQKGQSGNPAGRPKGIPNKATVQTKEFFGRILSDPDYQDQLIARMRSGEVAPAVETMGWYYWAGKPTERIELGADKNLAQLVAEAAKLTPEQAAALLAAQRALLPKP